MLREAHVATRPCLPRPATLLREEVTASNSARRRADFVHTTSLGNILWCVQTLGQIFYVLLSVRGENAPENAFSSHGGKRWMALEEGWERPLTAAVKCPGWRALFGSAVAPAPAANVLWGRQAARLWQDTRAASALGGEAALTAPNSGGPGRAEQELWGPCGTPIN